MTSGSGSDFLSGSSGQVLGIRRVSKAVVLDAFDQLISLALLEPVRLRRAAAHAPRRRVLVLTVERTDEANLLAPALAELERSRHHVAVARGTAGDRGKFENLNLLLAEHPPAGYDWVLVLDDDVSLPSGFLDRFLLLAERFGLLLAQPAHRHRSHAAWDVTRRRAGSLARETALVEIGPVSAFRSETFEVLLPFPPLRSGWGLDAHWSALARERRWRIGIVDATPIAHAMRRIAASYDRSDALAEAIEFLADRPYTPAAEAKRTIATHRSLR